ncbi:Double-strand break repair protein MRE11 [Triticum urartu]|uniref:Double-strand break repair protein MRE11 n=1 Tax=Triticum urartu TaxID=4572 RepID=M7YH70_TRIUA|nr:Double-strand break repair protein MRE11 [Triticum urartu]
MVANLIEKNDTTAGSGSEPKLSLVRIKVDYSVFLTIHPQRFGQKYVEKTMLEVPENSTQMSLINTLSKLWFRKNMQVLPLDNLDTAIHVFVNKADNMAFHSCLQKNTEEAIVEILTLKNEANGEQGCSFYQRTRPCRGSGVVRMMVVRLKYGR